MSKPLWECESFFNKVVNDSIHGNIELDGYLFAVIDTPQFQRLRELKQVGSAYYVYPGASHNRFEHSLGVCHLAGETLSHFKNTQSELDISDREMCLVQIAALCHDLGHGPFSHIFDGQFIPRARPGTVWKHEQASEEMFEWLVDDNGVDLDTADVKTIKDMIEGRADPNRKFLYQIVANKTNNVDVDKFDYIARDAKYVGMHVGFDHTRHKFLSRVINGEICYSHKEAWNIYSLFQTRYNLFKQVYTHKTGKAVELMIVDALLAADPYLHISDTIDDMRSYLHMNDSILTEIERSTRPELDEARKIIKRLRKRDLYRHVGTVQVSDEWVEKGYISRESVTAEAVLRHSTTEREYRELADNLIVDWLELGYGMKNQDPVMHCRFYSKHSLNESFSLDPHKHVSGFVPQKFRDVSIRVFVKEKMLRASAHSLFKRYLESLNKAYRGDSPLILSNRLDEEHELPETPRFQRHREPPGDFSSLMTSSDTRDSASFTSSSDVKFSTPQSERISSQSYDSQDAAPNLLSLSPGFEVGDINVDARSPKRSDRARVLSAMDADRFTLDSIQQLPVEHDDEENLYHSPTPRKKSKRKSEY